MNIHTYEKFWLAASMVLIVGFILTITYGSVGLGIAMIDDSSETVDPDNLDEHPGFSDPGIERVGENEYEVHVIAVQFAFFPGEIEVPAGSTVTIHLTSEDVIHSFSVVGTNANTMVIPGEIASLTVETDEPGEYDAACYELCGSGHSGMQATVIAMPNDDFENWYGSQVIPIDTAIEQLEAGTYAQTGEDSDNSEGNGSASASDTASGSAGGVGA
jgi:cytochrome c oxidase subunit 2